MTRSPQKLFVDVDAGVRECGQCHDVKPFSDFPDNKVGGKSRSGGPGGKQSYCRGCYRQYQREHRTPEYKRHGLTEEDFELLWQRQEGFCDICGLEMTRGRGVNIDHNHYHCPGKYGCKTCVRALLCPSCNMRLGTVEDPNWMVLAMDYLTRWNVL